MDNEYRNDHNDEYNYEGNYQYTLQPLLESEADKQTAPGPSPKKKHKAFRGFAKLVAMGTIIGLVAGASFQGYNYLAGRNLTGGNSIGEKIDETDLSVRTDQDNPSVDSEASSEAVPLATGTSDAKVTSDVSAVVENVMPSIVAINSVMTNVSSDFFGREFKQDVQGSGSGIIIGQNDKEVLIATNNHVVEGAKTVDIVFADDSKATASIKGTAAGADLAVVSVSIDDLKPETIGKIKIATLGDSNTTKLGEMAIAIGNALGYGQSVTVGYVSALNREVTIDGKTMTLLQTDAAINPGNSGGALLNSKGEVIGINSVKYVDSSVDSIGYAIPVSDAIPIINELMNRTVIAEEDTAYLGISGNDVTDVYSQGFGMPVGIYVAEVTKGSAAEKAGIQVGNIIVSINKTPVKAMAELQDSLSYIKGGSTGTITVKVLDNGTYTDKTLNVTFDTKPKDK